MSKEKVSREEQRKSNLESKRWQCKHCDKCFETRAKLTAHNKEVHPQMCKEGGWNKGLTSKDHSSIAKASKTYKERLASGQIVIKGHPHTEETKKKISEGRKKYLEENPDSIYFRKYHYATMGESYAEKYFREWLEEENIKHIAQQALGSYTLDFLIGNTNLEIDGEQHYTDERIIESDNRRTKYIESQGFKTIRIRWSHYQKLTQEEKQKYLERLKVALTTDNELNDSFVIDSNTLRKIYSYCQCCNKPIYNNHQKFCSRECVNKVVNQNKPKEFYDKLVSDLKDCNNNHSELARRYGISSKAIAKRIKKGIALGFISEYITNKVGH